MIAECGILFALVLTLSLNPVPLVHAQDDNPPGLNLILRCLFSYYDISADTEVLRVVLFFQSTRLSKHRLWIARRF